MASRRLIPNDYSYKSEDLEVLELPEAIHLAVITKAPEKYLLIDLENGQMYRGSNDNNQHLPGYKLWNRIK
jgi:hypothetical protein